MTPQQRNETIDNLFSQAVFLKRNAQSSLLDSVKVDPDVRREIEELLVVDRYLESRDATITHSERSSHGLIDPSDALPSLHDGSDTGSTKLLQTARNTDSTIETNKDRKPFPRGSGKTLGKFTILEVLGEGGYGCVWKAYDSVLERFVALKIPRDEISRLFNRKMVEREAKAAARFQHPNIVTIHEVIFENDRALIASEFIDGLTLSKALRTSPMPVRHAVKMCIKLADAIHYAHTHGVIHRDLKPSNILIDAAGEPHITDFGLAKRDLSETTISAEGNMLGTPAYMPPEQACGNAHTADSRSDIYSLGVILFEMLTDELPFRGDLQVLIKKAIHDDPPNPRSLKPSIPLDLEIICLKCLEKSPARRYQSAAEFAADLQAWLENKPIQARSVGKIERAIRLCSRYPTITGLAIAITLLTFVSLVTVTSLWIRANANQATAMRHLERRTAHFDQTIEVVERMLSRVIQREEPEFESVQQDLLREALSLYENLLDSGTENLPDRLIEDARIRMRIGNLHEALQNPEASLAAYQLAIDGFESAVSQTQSSEMAGELSECYRSLAKTIVALRPRDPALQIQCESAIQRALEIDRKLLTKTPAHVNSLSMSHNVYAGYFVWTNQIERAEQEYLAAIECLEIVKNDDTISRLALIWNKHKLADMYLEQGELEKSREIHENVLQQRLELVGKVPDVYRFHPSMIVRYPSPNQIFSLRRDIAASHRSLGQISEAQQDYVAVERHFRAAGELMDQVVHDHPFNMGHRKAYAGIHTRLANVLRTLGKQKEALEHFEKALSANEESMTITVDNDQLKSFADQHAAAATLAIQTNNADAAALHMAAALSSYNQLRLGQPENWKLYVDSIRLQLAFANFRTSKGDIVAADALVDEAEGLAETLKSRSESDSNQPDPVLTQALNQAESLLQRHRQQNKTRSS